MTECEHLEVVPVFTVLNGESKVPEKSDGLKCKSCGEEISILTGERT